jgi:hypothetical protein
MTSSALSLSCSVLEKYSYQDCAFLLGCSRQDIGETRMRTLLHVAESGESCTGITWGGDFRDDEESGTRETQMEPQVLMTTRTTEAHHL